MAIVSLYNINGEKVGSLELDASLFDVKSNPVLVHEAVVAQQANARVAIAHTKNRGEVAGSSKKPWKQKGTGRARHGSTKSPIWVGGGITFGPRNDRNFSLKINKRAKQKALAMVLSEKVAEDKLIVLDELHLKDGKTKELNAILKKLPIAKKNTVIILPPKQTDVALAAQNMKMVSTLPTNTLNVVDLLKANCLILSKDAMDLVTKMYARA